MTSSAVLSKDHGTATALNLYRLSTRSKPKLCLALVLGEWLMLQSLNILLVEDDEVDVMIVKRAFQKKRIAAPLTVAGDGEEALQILKQTESSENSHQGRMVLLDLNMPRMGGIEFLKELRDDPALKDTPVVVMTTSDDSSDRQRAYGFNIAGYILKPVLFDQFADTMEALTDYWSLCEMP